MLKMTIFQNVRTERQYKSATGLSITEFEQLATFFEKLYVPKTANPYLKAPYTPVLTHKKEALFFILYYYKTYPTLTNLGLSFGFTESTASGYIDFINPVLKAAYQQAGLDVCRTFVSQEAFDNAFAGVSDLIIDVTECPTNRPKDAERQKANYSGKKKGTRANG